MLAGPSASIVGPIQVRSTECEIRLIYISYPGEKLLIAVIFSTRVKLFRIAAIFRKCMTFSDSYMTCEAYA